MALNAGISRYMVNYNGAVLWNLETESVAKEVTIQSHVSQGLVELLKHTDVDYLFYENGEACYEVERPFMTTYVQRLEKLGLVPKHTNFTGFPFEHTQKCMVFGSDENVEAVVKTIQASYGDDLNLLVSRPYAHNQVVDIRYTFLEIMSIKADKSYMLSELAKMEGFTMENIMTFGDEFNDTRMLQDAGWGVAMGNAPKEVQQFANDVTLWHDEDGIAVYLEKHLL
ncbi:MAG: HAD hydrolase family protein [Brevinema sp.]